MQLTRFNSVPPFGSFIWFLAADDDEDNNDDDDDDGEDAAAPNCNILKIKLDTVAHVVLVWCTLVLALGGHTVKGNIIYSNLRHTHTNRRI